jgi:hypothetical protein
MKRMMLAAAAAVTAGLFAPPSASAIETWDCAMDVRRCAEAVSLYTVRETFETYDDVRAVDCTGVPVMECVRRGQQLAIDEVREKSYELLYCYCDPPSNHLAICRQFTGSNCL